VGVVGQSGGALVEVGDKTAILYFCRVSFSFLSELSTRPARQNHAAASGRLEWKWTGPEFRAKLVNDDGSSVQW
jgi:hypothetical protein